MLLRALALVQHWCKKESLWRTSVGRSRSVSLSNISTNKTCTPRISRLRPFSRNPYTNHRRDSKACSFDYFNMTSKSPIDGARRCSLLIFYFELISPTANKNSSHRSTPPSICLSDKRHRRNYAMQLTHTS